MGRDPLDIGAIWWDLWERTARSRPTSIGAVDVGLWDIAGKIAGLPIHRLLGTCRDKAPAYASLARHDTRRGLCRGGAALQDAAGRVQDPPAARPKDDIAICEAVREGGRRRRWC